MKRINHRQQIAYKYREQLKEKATEAEKIVNRILNKLNVSFVFQAIFMGKKRFVIADFFLKDHRIVLEIDGKNHGDEWEQIYDDYRTKFLMNRCGIISVIRIKNEEVFEKQNEVEDMLFNMFSPRRRIISDEIKEMNRQFKETIDE